MRKPNSTGKVWTELDDAQRAEVRRWLETENLGYRVASERIREKWGKDIDKNSLWRFLHSFDADRIQERVFRSAALANDIISEAEANPADSFRALTEILTRLSLLQASGEQVDMKGVVALAKAACAGRKQLTAEIAEQRSAEELQLKLRQYEDKVAAQKREIEGALAKAREGGVTAETLQRIEEAVKIL